MDAEGEKRQQSGVGTVHTRTTSSCNLCVLSRTSWAQSGGYQSPWMMECCFKCSTLWRGGSGGAPFMMGSSGHTVSSVAQGEASLPRPSNRSRAVSFQKESNYPKRMARLGPQILGSHLRDSHIKNLPMLQIATLSATDASGTIGTTGSHGPSDGAAGVAARTCCRAFCHPGPWSKLAAFRVTR